MLLLPCCLILEVFVPTSGRGEEAAAAAVLVSMMISS